MEYLAIASPRSGEEFSEDTFVLAQMERRFTAAVIDTHHFGAISHQAASEVATSTGKTFFEGLHAPLKDPFMHAFHAADEHLLRRHPAYGAVATAVQVTDTVLRVAQLGDSRLYVSAWGPTGFQTLTSTHTASSVDELKRLEPHLRSKRFQVRVDVHHGRVSHRLYYKRWFGWSQHGLIPTRALGDVAFRPALTPQPETYEYDRRKLDQGAIYVLCSDGAVWAVERMFGKIRGRAPLVEFEEVCTLLNQGFAFTHDDDATAIAFRF